VRAELDVASRAQASDRVDVLDDPVGAVKCRPADDRGTLVECAPPGGAAGFGARGVHLAAPG
jgi:hypothetical protein